MSGTDIALHNHARAGALFMASMGMHVHPIHGVVNGICTCKSMHTDKPKECGKHPAMNLTFKNAVTDAAAINSWFAQHPALNYGVATGIQIAGTEQMLVVIDVDSYKGDEVDDALRKLEAEHGKLPETAEVITGGGGRHLYFMAKAGTKFAQKLGHDGIDIKGIGGYVIGPGSRHRSGDTYEWEGSSDPTEGQQIAELPQWVYDKFAKPEAPVKAAQVQPGIKLTANELASIQEDLQIIPADDRDVWLKVLMALKSGSDSEVMFALADQWSSKSESYLGTDDVRKTWDSLKRDGGITIRTVARLAAEFRAEGADITKLLANLAEKSKPHSDEWPDIELLDATGTPAPYPIDALPLIMRDAVHEVQDFAQAPLAMVAGSALSALSLAGQALYDVKRAEGLTGPIGLFMMAIAESGERKSTLDNHFTKAIHAYEAACAEDAKPAIKEYATAMQGWEAKNKGILDKLTAATRAENKPTDKIDAELHAHREQMPEQPIVQRLIYGDTTPEALAQGLATAWPSGGVISSEGGAVLGGHGMKTDNQMGNMAMINALWDGNPIRVDRRTSQSFTVKNARLTVAVQVQPATFDAFMKKAGVLARGSGFMARFMVAFPESTQGTRLFRDPPADWPKRDAFCARLTELLNTPVAMQDGGLEPEMLALSSAAKEVWVEFYNRTEQQLGKGGAFRDVRDVASKTADNAARVAALFHVVDGAQGEIQRHHMQGAVRIAEWHLCESQRILATSCYSPEDMEAMELLEWLICRMKESGVTELSMTEVSQYGPSKFRKKPARDPVVGSLVEQGYARVVVGKSQKIAVNPKLLG